MAQSFKYASELLAGFPDNVTGLITAEHMRDTVVSLINGRGLLEATGNTSLPIESGTYIQINPLLSDVGAAHSETYWNFDGNNFGYANHSNFVDTAVPAGHTRLVQMMAILELTKAGGGADDYAVQFSENSVGIGEPESVEFDEAGTQTVTLLHPALVDVSDPSVLYGVQIVGQGTSDDLTMGYFSMQFTDSILLAAP